MNNQDYHGFAVALAKKAGALLKEARKGVFEVINKGGEPRDQVTSVDLEINKLFISEIKKSFPEHGIYSEEGGGEKNKSEYMWVIDPIDGTSNFARDIPHFASCLALLQNGEPIVGVVYNPVTDELFSFNKGTGAFLNGRNISVSKVSELKDAQALLHIGRKENLWDWGVAVQKELLRSVKKVKDLGSSGLDLCFLAAGRADIVAYGMLTTMDVASAIGLIRAAGGEVYTPSGEPVDLSEKPQPVVATANRVLFDKIRSLIHPELLPR